jgi:hypothetical protein
VWKKNLNSLLSSRRAKPGRALDAETEPESVQALQSRPANRFTGRSKLDQARPGRTGKTRPSRGQENRQQNRDLQALTARRLRPGNRCRRSWLQNRRGRQERDGQSGSRGSALHRKNPETKTGSEKRWPGKSPHRKKHRARGPRTRKTDLGK